MTSARPPISIRQNEPYLIELRQAAAAVHEQALRVESVRIGVSLILATSGIFAAFFRLVLPPIAIAGAVWAVVLATGINPWVKGLAKCAATLQEMFDVEVFELPWNKTICGSRLPRFDCSQLARKFTLRGGRADRFRDWYVNVGGIPQPYDILFCQLQNLAWDARLRHRWSHIVLALVIAWIGLGALVGFFADLTLRETLVSWYLPAMGAFLLAFENYRGQVEVASERERLMQIVQSELKKAKKPPLSKSELKQIVTASREIQDVIFATRKHTARVPNWFYSRYRPGDEQDFRVGADDLRRQLTA
jgi:hypothetical protein